jgi:hypothetical protein
MLDEQSKKLMLREGEAVSYRAEIAAAQAQYLQNVLREVEKRRPSPEVLALRKNLSEAQKNLAAHLNDLDIELLKLHKHTL